MEVNAFGAHGLEVLLSIPDSGTIIPHYILVFVMLIIIIFYADANVRKAYLRRGESSIFI